jgi:hypothetical protein
MRGRVKGSPKTPGSGRRKGIPNKDSLPLEEKAKNLGIDPFTTLLLFAKGDWKALGYERPTETRCGKGGETYEIDVITADHRLKAASEACQYLHAKRKAVEVNDITDPSLKPIPVIISRDEIRVALEKIRSEY